ncbi:tetratricopeptide repeat protein [Kutzneria sp. CA-103260]|uniref:tetratricopeptide repeat protein n=1 Tax=Kutzneria sp. CA-103260 TaxID=2802641 RepID=UPI001BA47BCA|nr:tetratricopeptide repeat protein [Kutzneria sp. CA-103260]QUQ64616.1 Tetratricopeptide repeat protein [Kutzneria sp. CA-103260]
MLLIVDYADRWAHSELVRLLSDPLLHQLRPTRVILIGRTVRWYAAIRGELSDSRASVGDLPLLPLAADRLLMFTTARDRYCEPDLYDLPDATSIRPPESLVHDDLGLTLTVHMAALVAVDAHKRGRQPPGKPHELSAYLLDREYQAWQRLFDAGSQGQDYRTRPAIMARVVFTAALTGAVSHATGIQVLRALDLPRHPQDLLLDHRFCYPPANRELVLEPLYPDRLAEDFLGLLTPGHDVSAYDPDPWANTIPATLLNASDGLRSAAAPHAVTFLASAATRWPHLGAKVLYPLLRADPSLALDAGSSALTALAGIDDIPDDVLEPIVRSLPEGRHIDLDVGAAAITLALATRLLGTITGLVSKARLHVHCSNRLDAAGRRDEALVHSHSALDCLNELITINVADSVAYLPDMATATGNHALQLANVGRWSEALEYSQSTVAVYEVFARTDASTYLGALAAAVNNHALLVANTGQRSKALHYSRRAVGHYRKLVKANRVAYLPELAMSLANHATNLRDAGQWSRALDCSHRAVEHYDELAQGDPAATYLPHLAASVANHAAHLKDAGHRDEALAHSHRAVTLHEKLANANAAAYLPDLARAWSNHAQLLVTAGRGDEALSYSLRAVECYGKLVEGNRVTHLPNLAMSMATHAANLAYADRRDEALTYSHHALALREELVAVDRAANLPNLAAVLWTFTLVRSLLGEDLHAAAEVGVQAVDVYRELAAGEPAPFAVGLHAASATLANVLNALSSADEAEQNRDVPGRGHPQPG